MSDPLPRAADLLARRLYEAGCRHAFGMPGGEVLTLVDALDKAGITFHLAKHENAAGFMAEAVHHRDGAPAILLATLGPGAMNGVNVVANALQDRVPMIVLTGCVDADEALTYTHQVMDHAQVFRPITKGSFRLTAEGSDIIADKAVSLAMQPRPGPVHIDVPIGVAATPVRETRRRRLTPAAPVAPGGTCLESARRWVAEARHPLAVIGLDVLADGSKCVLQAFLEHFEIPFVTTYKAKGILPEDHRLCLGGAGLSPLADGHLLPLVQAADLILCLGYDPIEMRPGWREVWDPESQRVIDISAVVNDHYMHQAGINIVADTGATLEAIAKGTTGHATWPGGEPQAARAALARAFPQDEVWGPAAIIAETRATLPEGTLATADSGAHRILLSQMWRCDEPRGLIQSSGLCTMGCALPMAIGLKLAEPDRPVISFSGDAGFLMVAGELSTAAEMGGNPIFLVFVDASLSLIELKQRGRQLPNRGVDFGHHDFAAIGRAFGGHGHTVRSRAELRAALEAAQAADRFTVIAAEIARGDYDGRI
ncbi:thiamine pyrophosphate-binding protein [Ruegeria pomeroyi]|uniref:Acetolactate synthase, catabolic, putative n=2 Tax=Ruegeria pomeroyi TaxID=89184 RepID=Q5LPG3_RUEPO|nr:thiamine pyrophosphate-binding protein [Ruegeria pomeroyi]AAV96126.1 acetolactate synthase, catabolic, putative [Ruegeria pomeroyi DSS-3]NVK97325.1 thiamine pyrophosphate-binding protein [Ruegeria pomeroyi]NVL01994.1 thiamine pyrophosphate-binding protein [Ruegeria pomeroyi]QWV09679.1 thiamine pyrophosphate-binding protein [Ruegeria pomeroyi]